MLKRTLIDLIISMLFAVLFTRVFTIDVNNTYLGEGHDSFFNCGIYHITKDNIQNGKMPFSFTDTFRYPFGFDYQCGFDGVIAIFTAVGLNYFFNPTFSYNIMIVILLTLNIFFSIIYFRKISKELGQNNSYLIILCAALIFGYSPYVASKLSNHVNLAFVGGFPILLYSVIKVLRDSKNKNLNKEGIITFFASLLLLAFGSVQYLLLLVHLIPALFLVSLIHIQIKPLKAGISRSTFSYVNSCFTELTKISNLHKLLLPFSLFILIFFVVYFGYFECLFLNKAGFHLWVGKSYLLDLFVPNPYLGDWWNIFNLRSVKQIEFVVTPGVISLGLLVYLISKNKSGYLTQINLFMFLLVAGLSTNVVHMLLVPEGGRSVVVFSLFISLYIIYLGTYIKPNIALIIFLLLIVERLLFVTPHSYIKTKAPLSELQNYNSTALLNIPMSIWSDFSVIYNAEAQFHGKKILDGHIHPMNLTYNNHRFIRNYPLSRFSCNKESTYFEHIKYPKGEVFAENTDALLKSLDVKLVVIHKEFLNRQECSKQKDYWQEYISNTKIDYKTLYSDSNIEILGY